MNKNIFYIIIFVFSLFAVSCNDNKDDNKDDDKDGGIKDIINLSTKELEFSGNKGSKSITTKGDWWWFSSIFIDDDILTLDPDQNTINGEWFSIERENKKITISVEKNETGENRGFTISLQAGNYFDYINVSQD